MAYKLQLKRGVLASLPNGSVGEPLFTTDTFDLYVGKGDGTNVKIQKFIASGSSSQFLKGDGSLDSNTYIGLTALSASAPLSYNNTTGAFTISQASGSTNGYLSSGDWTTFNAKQAALSGSGIVKSTGGTISYLTDNSANWDTAYNDKINSASVSGTTTKTLTLTQQDGGTITTSWSDYDTAPVTSVFGRTGDVVAANGDYTTSQVTEGTNLYYTDARARAAITLTTTGSSGASTYVGGTLNIPTYTLVGLGGVASSRQLTINGTSYDLSADRSWSVGTVTSVDMSVPTGFAISGNPITSSGTLALAFASGYSLPTNASQTNWDAAYNDKINSASVSGTTTKTLTLTQQDGGTITASWTDDNTDAVTSVFGRTGAVVAQSGDYTTTQVTEGTNLYYTEARVSANTDVAANTAARHNAVTLGTANGLSLSTQQLSLALASGSTTGALSSTDWTTFNNKENAITAGTTLQYYRGDKTFQTLNTSVVPESANLYYTDTRSRAALSFTAGSGAYNSTTGVITIPTNTNQLTNGAAFITLGSLSASAPLSYNNGTGAFTISQANSTTDGFLSSTDWNTFNNKQNAITNPVTGTGTTNYVTKWTSSSAVGNSNFYINSDNLVTSSSPYIYSNATSGGTTIDAGLRIEGSNKYISFLTTDTERMRITSGGNLLLNSTTDSGERLQITGNTMIQGEVRIRRSGTQYGTIYASSGLDFFVESVNNAAIYYNSSASLHFWRNNGTNVMQLNASGNLGLGVVPTSGVGDVKHFEIESGGRFVAAGNNAEVGANYYYDSAYKYITSNAVTRFEMNGGAFRFYNAASGTANSPISFTQAMTLTANGRLLLGTTTEGTYLLDVNGTGRFLSGLYVRASGNSDLPFINFSNADGAYNWGRIGGLLQGDGDGSLYFQTKLGASLGTRLTITSTGAATFSSSVTATGAGLQPMIHAKGGGDALGQGKGNFRSSDQGGANYFDFGRDNLSTGNFVLTSGGGTPLLSITTTGAATFSSSVTAGSSMYTNDIGINTTNIGAKITVFGSTSPNLGMSLEPAGWNGAKHRFNVPTSGDASMLSFNWNGSVVDYASYATSAIGISNGYLTFSTASSAVSPAERMRITGGGEVILNNSASSADVTILRMNGGGSGYPVLRFSTGGTLQSQIYSYANTLFFDTNGSERGRITSGGNLLVGTTSDSGQKLIVAGDSFINGNLLIGLSSGNTAWMTIQSGNTSKAQINLSTSTAPTSPTNGDIWFDGTNLKMRIGGVTKTFTLT